MKAKLAIVCPIANTSNPFPLHIPLDSRTKTTGVILTERIKCLDVISRNIPFSEKMSKDLLDKILVYVNAFF
ncbi:type II toxin-antitoxin system PemK/MazF family toxin [Schaedlerella sp.]|uniref:type II toxin-antitoxin system PemK/MazF family toxin n=1 Tax=Schaedlerella sp. TaxID=2676057 RepID=UPI003748C4D9